MHKPIPQLIAHVLYKYDAETGKIVSRRRNREVGTTRSDTGYGIVTICCNRHKTKVRTNRLAWAMHTGWDPADSEIDHINGVRDDNRISNLQPLSAEDNLRKAHGTATLGVYQLTPQLWQAKLQRNGITYRGTSQRCPLLAKMEWYELDAVAG